MEWTAWNNGNHSKTGAGYGFKVIKKDRDNHFVRRWKIVTVELPVPNGYRNVRINIDKDSFWSSACRELISKEIGQWLQLQGLAPWPKNLPPKFQVTVLSPGNFRII